MWFAGTQDCSRNQRRARKLTVLCVVPRKKKGVCNDGSISEILGQQSMVRVGSHGRKMKDQAKHSGKPSELVGKYWIAVDEDYCSLFRVSGISTFSPYLSVHSWGSLSSGGIHIEL